MRSLRLPFAVALLSAVWSAPLFALDFTLKHQGGLADGAKSDNAYITDGSNKIFLRIPNTWKVSDSAQALDLIPQQSGSRVVIEQVSGKQALAFDAAGQHELDTNAGKTLPAGSKNVTELPPRTDLLPIFGWTTLEICHRYEFYGQGMRRGILYVNMIPGRVVQVTVTAPDAVFDAVHEQMRLVMSGWFEPKRDLPPDLARKYEEGTLGGS